MAEYLVYSPEHVAIRLYPAGLGRRTASFLADLCIVMIAISVANSLLQHLPGAASALLITTVDFLLFWGYHVFFEVRHEGQTPGKRMCRLRVVDGRGLPIDARQSLVRNLIRTLDMIPFGGLGMVCCLSDPHQRRLGDLAAGTLVVEEHREVADKARGMSTRRQNSLDTPRMRRLIANRISLEEREFLLAACLRADALTEQGRYRLFEAVGAHYRTRLEVEDDRLSGENLVRNVVALCFAAK
jgi:uncharacterized RDD family membrane protein YckC